MEVLLNCVICNQLIFCEEDGEDDEEEGGIKCSSLELGLQLLYKLLRNNVTMTIRDSFYFGQAVGKLSSFSTAPCCDGCGVVFGEMVRLQQAIEEFQMSLMEQVTKLKTSLLTSIPPDYQEDPLKIPGDQDALELIREQLLSSVRKTTISTSSTLPVQHVIGDLASIAKRKRQRHRHPPPDRSKTAVAVPLKKSKEYLPCSVVLERIPIATLQTSQVSLSKPTIKTDFDSEENSDVDSDPEFVPSPQQTGSNHNYSSNDDDDDYPWESEVSPVEQDIQIKQENPTLSPEKNKTDDEGPPTKFRRIANKKHKPNLHKKFHQKTTTSAKPPIPGKLDVKKFSIIIPDTLLLYQTTFIKVSPGYSQLICQEPQCPSPIFSPESPLNWKSLFAKIAKHIDSTHTKAYFYLRPCPLCGIKLKGRELRAHLIGRQGVHHVEPVVCDICLKPVRNVSDYYRAHQWLHKNDNEKTKCSEGPPLKIRKLKQMPAPIKTPSSTQLISQIPSKLDVKKFSIILPDNLLLYQTTLIKVLNGYSELICQEPRCLSPIFSSEDPLNWKSLFVQLADHIDTIHDEAHLNFRPCPLCDIELKGRELRAHLIGRHGEHHVEAVVCEICLKPVRNVSDNYKRHQWRHKNYQDKTEPLKDPPLKPAIKKDPSSSSTQLIPQKTIKLDVKKFSIIFSDNLLLYQTTFIKVSPGYSQLICQEPQCPSPIFSSEDPLNWNSLFLQLAIHIDTTHDDAHLSLKNCPLCPIQLKGKELRAHLVGKFGVHHADQVTCEICLKPVRNVSDNYRVHQWRHKNDEEKVKCLEGPPLKIRIKSSGSIPQPQLKSKDTLHPIPRTPGPEKFWIISPDTLLYQNTLIKVSQGYTLFTCQQPECPSPLFSSGGPFNWTTLFDQMASHINSVHFSEEWNFSVQSCPLCGIKVEEKDLRVHLIGRQGVHRVDRVACTICWKPVRNKSDNYRTHQWYHHNKKDRQTCLEASPYFRRKAMERAHKLNKKKLAKPKTFPCEECGKVFNIRARLRYHEEMHKPKELRKHYKCPQCPKMYLDAVAVRGHVEREHQRELMRWRTCPICSKKYNWRAGYQFRTHLRSHTNERPFVCETCGRAFLNTEGLKRHKVKVHDEKREERGWQCEFCEMNYKESKNLRRHRRSAHKEEVEGEMTEEERLKATYWEYRPDFIGPRIAFPCPACEKVFPLKSRMKKHFDKFCKAN